MRQTILISISITLALALTTVALGGECSESDRNTLKKMDQDWATYNQQGDRAALDAILADSYSSFTIDGTTDKAVALAALDSPPPADPPGSGFLSDNYIISCSGDTAVMTHRNEISEPSGLFFTRSVHIFQKSEGKWRVIASVNHPMDDAGALMYLNYSGMEAYKRRDIEWFEKYTHAAYFTVSPTGEVVSRSEVFARMKADKSKLELLKMTDLDANVDGDMGIVTGIVHAKGVDADGNPFEGKSRFTRTFIKKDGRWLAVSTHSTRLGEN
ncbi:MAG TPA: nuclear transport factor 2 family protein [Aridibacter sp.]|nr:nuclear transport factor 2 family protein [Aridibacter sp.]